MPASPVHLQTLHALLDKQRLIQGHLARILCQVDPLATSTATWLVDKRLGLQDSGIPMGDLGQTQRHVNKTDLG